MSDNVKHPSHYMGEIETIDYIRDKLTPDQFVGYCLGNVMKYISRYQKKGTPLEDLQKAQVYLGWAAETQEMIIDLEQDAAEQQEALESQTPENNRGGYDAER